MKERSSVSKKELWTILAVTSVTVLIWFWAAGENLTQPTVSARIEFVLPEPQSWLVSPQQRFVTITMEGSKLTLQRADQVLRRGLQLPLPAQVGRQNVNLVDAVRSLRELEATGVRILAVEPATLDVDIDSIVRVPSRVRAALPGVQTVGDISIEPSEVLLAMPQALRQRFPGELPVEAFVDRARVDRLEPGQQHTLDVTLRPPDGLAGADGVLIDPPSARLVFTVRSRMREVHLESVRIQLAGPPEDNREYLVDIEQTLLRDVTISAESDLIRRIESGEVTVVAMLHLSNREKEQGIERKAITYFLAIVPDADGTTRGVVVEARIGDQTAMPVVDFQVTRRSDL
jgi:hypothetical protein